MKFEWTYSEYLMDRGKRKRYSYTLRGRTDEHPFSYLFANFVTNKNNPHRGKWQTWDLLPREIANDIPDRFNYTANINEAKAYFETLARLAASN